MPSEKVPLAENPVHKERLGFRLDEQTKGLIERAAHLESRKLTDFCVATLTDAARRLLQSMKHSGFPILTGMRFSIRSCAHRKPMIGLFAH